MSEKFIYKFKKNEVEICNQTFDSFDDAFKVMQQDITNGSHLEYEIIKYDTKTDSFKSICVPKRRI